VAENFITMLDLLTKAKTLIETEPPSITDQNWDVKMVDFRKGKPEGVDYFNASLLPGPKNDWLFVRRSKFQAGYDFGMNDIMVFEYKNDKPERGWKLSLDALAWQEHAEDMRLWLHNGKLFASACTFLYIGKFWSGAHQAVWEIDLEHFKSLKRYDPVFGNNEEKHGCKKGFEKNWLFYSYKGAHHLLYQSDPFTIAIFDEKFKPFTKYVTDGATWNYGPIRGGSNPLIIDGIAWTFFHSSRDKQIKNGKRRYYAGFMGFDPDTHKVKYLTKEPILVASTKDRWFADKPACIFPGSCHVKNKVWHVAFGVNDLDTAVGKFPHERLLSLVSTV